MNFSISSATRANAASSFVLTRPNSSNDDGHDDDEVSSKSPNAAKRSHTATRVAVCFRESSFAIFSNQPRAATRTERDEPFPHAAYTVCGDQPVMSSLGDHPVMSSLSPSKTALSCVARCARTSLATSESVGLLVSSFRVDGDVTSCRVEFDGVTFSEEKVSSLGCFCFSFSVSCVTAHRDNTFRATAATPFIAIPSC